MSQKTKGYVWLLAVFALGSSAGVGGGYAYASRQHAAILRDEPQRADARRLVVLDRKLGLDADQQGRIRVILASDREESRALSQTMMTACGQPLRDHKAAVDASIRDVLRPDQQGRFDHMTEERRKHARLGDAGLVP